MQGALYYRLETLSNGFGPSLRRMGQNMFRKGANLQGAAGSEDARQPSLRCIPISESKYPKLLDSDWVAPNAVVVGDVKLGEGSSLWHGVIVRGDTAAVSIGKNTSVQDLTRIASSQRAPGDQVKIGENCYIGANVSMDACTIEDNSFVGMGASVGRGARIEPFAVVSAGAVIPAGTTVPSGQIFAGAPARYLRDLTQEEKHLMTEHKLEMQQMSQIYEEHTSKTFREQLNHRDELDKYRLQDVQDKFEDMLGEMGMPTTHEDMEYIEHRIYHDYTGQVEFNVDMQETRHRDWDKKWTPYEQDLSQYPEVFRRYQENYERYDRQQRKYDTENPFEEQGPDQHTRLPPRDMTPWTAKYDMLMPKFTGTSCQ